MISPTVEKAEQARQQGNLALPQIACGKLLPKLLPAARSTTKKRLLPMCRPKDTDPVGKWNQKKHLRRPGVLVVNHLTHTHVFAPSLKHSPFTSTRPASRDELAGKLLELGTRQALFDVLGACSISSDEGKRDLGLAAANGSPYLLYFSLSPSFLRERERVSPLLSPHFSCFVDASLFISSPHRLSASCTPESSILAFSAASVRRCKACLSFRRSMPSPRFSWHL